MEKQQPHHSVGFFERIATAASSFTGSTFAFVGAAMLVVLWLITGPVFHYSETWQLVINTGTTIVTFLMIFLIQRAQNKDSRAIHLKLNELIASQVGPSNRLVNAESFSEKELRTLQRFYRELDALATKDSDLTMSHSIEEAQGRHRMKYPRRTNTRKGHAEQR